MAMAKCTGMTVVISKDCGKKECRMEWGWYMNQSKASKKGSLKTTF